MPSRSTQRQGRCRPSIGLSLAYALATILASSLVFASGASAVSNVDLLSQSNLRIDGATASDYSGYSVAGAGDLNGDGRGDVIVGAYLAGNNGRGNSGSSYVIYGAASQTTIDLNALTQAQGFRIDGAVADDRSGISVSGAGDVNGDGRDDVIVGADLADNNGRNGSGSSYVIYGAASQTTIDLSALTQAQGFRIDGAAFDDRSGYAVAGAGDVNGDGRDDVIVGARLADNNGRGSSGSSYVIYGAASQTTIDLNALTQAQGFRIDGAAAFDNSGYSVAGAGDVNGDGRDDVIVGTPYADNNVRTNSGSSYVIYGAASQTTIDLNALAQAQGFRIDGAVADDRSGISVSGAGDVNGDGRDDVIVGADLADNNGRNGSGSSYVIYGAASQTTIDLNALTQAQGFRIDGATAGDGSGGSVSGAGDVNGDGRDDVITGAQFAGNNGRSESGTSYVVYGAASQTTIDLNALTQAQGFRIDGAAVDERSGYSVAGAGDVNGDGRGDVIVGTPFADNNGRTESGSSYLVLGGSDPPTAVNDSKTVDEDAAATTIDVLANDTDPDGGPMTVASKTNGSHGQVAITNSGADLTYTPDAGYCGPDSFTYTLNGGSTATVSITVTCKPPTGADASASAPKKQKVHGKKVMISVDLAATADVRAVVSGKCEPEGSRKSLALKRQDVDLKAGETLTLKLVPKKNPKLIRRALARGHKVVAQIQIRFYGADGSVKLQRLRVKLK